MANGHGGAREGSGRKTGYKVPASIKAMVEDLRDYSPRVRDRLLKLIDSQDEDIALRAIELYYNRGYGKPKEEITLIGADTEVKQNVHLRLFELKKALELAQLPFSHLVSRDMKLIEEITEQKTNGEAQERSIPE